MQVAAVHAGAGHDQIAHAGQAREGFRLAAHGQTQPGQLGVAAGDKGGLGVIAVAQAQCDADGQRNDIFDRAAQLGAAAVGVGVDAEGSVVRRPSARFWRPRPFGGHDGGGHVAGILGAWVGPDSATTLCARPWQSSLIKGLVLDIAKASTISWPSGVYCGAALFAWHAQNADDEKVQQGILKYQISEQAASCILYPEETQRN